MVDVYLQVNGQVVAALPGIAVRVEVEPPLGRFAVGALGAAENRRFHVPAAIGLH